MVTEPREPSILVRPPTKPQTSCETLDKSGNRVEKAAPTRDLELPTSGRAAALPKLDRDKLRQQDLIARLFS